MIRRSYANDWAFGLSPQVLLSRVQSEIDETKFKISRASQASFRATTSLSQFSARLAALREFRESLHQEIEQENAEAGPSNTS